jgi:hypothetical protein
MARAEEAECSTCEQLRPEEPDTHTFEVVPADGGGWSMWSAALLRLLQRVGHEPTRVIIITQPLLTNRYVQLLIGHGIAHAEVGSNIYLTGESRLSADQEELLTILGWQAPTSDVDARDEMPANWTLPLVHGDWQHLTEMFASTMIGILGFSEHLPIEVVAFGADNPCRDCSWSDQLEADGHACSSSGGISRDISPISDNGLGRGEVDI